ncbi:MAG: hypothetical protein EBX52_01535 [Proteobacteria bacterium]|nr:hypothetical protein [Pseudomonadota bacterium]
MRTILILLSVLFIQHSANAQWVDDSPAIQAAIDLRNQFVDALERKDFTAFAHQGMDGAVRTFARDLESGYNDAASANELIRLWEQSSIVAALVDSKVADIGDHAPLFPQINEFLDKLAAKYGTIIYTLPVVKNIVMLNYALPVVFKPNGPWRTDVSSNGLDLRIEYRKHFIPFANIVTYYVTLLGCEYIVQHQGQPDLKKICKPVAEKLEFAMGRYIAPVVSDWIFNASTQTLRIGEDRLHYNTVDDLRRAIRQ